MPMAWTDRLPPVRRAMPWVLLALSVALNLFFLAGLWYRTHALPPVFAAPADLDLPPAQMAQLRQMRVELRQGLRQARQDQRALTDDLWAELVREPLNRAKVHELIDKLHRLRGDTFRLQTEKLMDFLATLPPDQRHAYAQQARKRQERFSRTAGFGLDAPHGPPPPGVPHEPPHR